MEELWKDIEGYEGLYQISNLGNVKSLRRTAKNQYNEYIKLEKLLKPRKKDDGYLQVCLYKNGKKNRYIHRLVASAFIPNLENKLYVNHKDFNKENNIVTNLEWTTRVENFRHYKNSWKWNETFQKRDKKLASKTLQRTKLYKDEIIMLYEKKYSIEAIEKKLHLGRDFVTDVLHLFDII